MADDFDVVSVRIEDKGAVVIRMVMGDARAAVVAPALGQCCRMPILGGAVRRVNPARLDPDRSAGPDQC
jgi:hypothetical protein